MSSVARYVLDNPATVQNMAKDARRWIKKADSDTLNEVAFKTRESGGKTGKAKRRLVNSQVIKGESSIIKRAAAAYKSGLLVFIGKSLYKITSFEKKGDRVHFEKSMIINRGYEKTLIPVKNFFFRPVRKRQKTYKNCLTKIWRRAAMNKPVLVMEGRH